jgi:transcriptional regulator with XRE-family HTH domain
MLAAMDLRQIVATNLRRIRRERGLSQEALAWDAGVNRSHMAVIETGKSWVRLDIVAKLAAALEVEPHELLLPPKRGRRTQAAKSSTPAPSRSRAG